MKALFIFIALLQLSPVACNRSPRQTSSSERPSPVTSPKAKRDPLELSAVELHKVKLARPHKLREKDGKERVYEQAWLVLLTFKNLGPVDDLGMDLYIGDYRIPEYGGFKDGIYFRIYDESLLQSWQGQEFSVSFAGDKKKSLGKTFSTEGYKNLAIEEESAVLKR